MYSSTSVRVWCVALALFFLGLSRADAQTASPSVSAAASSFSRAGARLLFSSGVSSQSVGGALLDEFGNYVGVIGGSIVPSANPVRILALLNESGASSSALDWETTGLAVPQALLPDLPSAGPATPLAELASRGEFAPLVIKSTSIQYMSVSSSIGKDSGSIPFPRDSKQIFSRRDARAVVYVNWQTAAKQKFVCSLRLFTTDNKMISASKAQQVSLAPGKYFSNHLGTSRRPDGTGHLPRRLAYRRQDVLAGIRSRHGMIG